MSFHSTIFRTPDSKYFLRTAFRVTVVPLLTLLAIAYSLWLYLDMNYYFFASRGSSISAEVKDAFIDNLTMGQVEYLPYVALFFICVFFIGLFLAHLVLRPFRWVAQMCRETMEQGPANIHLDAFTRTQLVVRATSLLLNFTVTRQHNVPEKLARVNGPRPDFVFYFQYGVCMLILSFITAAAIYLGLNHIHEEIVNSALGFLKGDAQISKFLLGQQELIGTVALLCSSFSVALYGFIAHGLVKDVEGVSYAYLRDIRKVIEGDYGRRLRPRFVDPGTEAALAINTLLDHYFPNDGAEVDPMNPPPPMPGTEPVGQKNPNYDQISAMFNGKK